MTCCSTRGVSGVDGGAHSPLQGNTLLLYVRLFGRGFLPKIHIDNVASVVEGSSNNFQVKVKRISALTTICIKKLYARDWFRGSLFFSRGISVVLFAVDL